MAVESASWPVQLNSSWPLDTDTRREGAAHIRTTKTAVKNWAKMIDGSDFPSGINFASATHPVGSLYVGLPTINSNPGDDIGGTWGFLGQVSIDQGSAPINGGNTPPAINGPVAKTLWVWVRLT